MGISRRKKTIICSYQDFKCEQCKKKKYLPDLRVHRLNRGYQGGTYKDHRNLKVLCISCHKKYHQGEFK